MRFEMAELPNATFQKLLATIRGDDVVEIPVGDKVALVDAEDAPLVSQYRWRLNVGYAYVYGLGSMQRLLMKPPKGKTVDHIDGDRLNNQRYNLRICTHAENMRNRNSATGASRFKGVWLCKGSWRARIGVDGRYIGLGSFASERKAAKAYDKAALELHGEFARTNKDLDLY
jgi:hypothetical protein